MDFRGRQIPVWDAETWTQFMEAMITTDCVGCKIVLYIRFGSWIMEGLYWWE